MIDPLYFCDHCVISEPMASSMRRRKLGLIPKPKVTWLRSKSGRAMRCLWLPPAPLSIARPGRLTGIAREYRGNDNGK